MPKTLELLLTLLRYLALPSVAGALATILFSWLRSQLPLSLDAEPTALRRFGVQLRCLLSAPRYARWASLLLIGLLGGGARIGTAALTGGDVGAIADTVIAGLLTIIVSQAAHGLTLSAAVPDPATLQVRLNGLNEQEPRT